MRVLMTLDAVGGVFTYAFEIVRSLEARGVVFLLASVGPAPSASQMRMIEGCKNAQLVHGNFPLEWAQRPWSEVDQAATWLQSLERVFQPDIIHLNSFTQASYAWSNPTLVVAHSCVLSWHQAVRKAAAGPEWAEYQVRVKRGLEDASMIVAPSRAMLDSLRIHYGLRNEGLVVPNTRSLSQKDAKKAERRPEQKRAEKRAEKHAEKQAGKRAQKQPYIFSAGRLWDEAKNLMALDAIAENLPWPVLVAGDLMPRGINADAYTPSRKAIFVNALGPLDQESVLEWMSGAAIYALPARYEPFGLSVLEAALSGCALVLGDIPSLRELWDGAAIFVSPDDLNQLRSALLDLIRDEAFRHEMADRAAQRSASFAPWSFGQAYFDAYRALASESKMDTLCAS